MVGEYCAVSQCNDTSGFCDCNGNGKLDQNLNETGYPLGFNETGFDCNDFKLAVYGVNCAEYCPTVCNFTFYSNEECNQESGPDPYIFSIYGDTSGTVNKMKSFQDRAKTNKDFKKHAIEKWTHVNVNIYGCKLDIFSDNDGKNENNDDQTVTIATGDEDKKWRVNGSGACTKLKKKNFVHSVRATKPCLDMFDKSHASHSKYLEHKHEVSHRNNTFTKDAKPVNGR